MVKRVDSSKGASRSIATGEVNRTTSSGEVDSVRQVGGGKGAAGASRVRRPTRPMTAAERSELLRLVQEEAESMLGGTLSEKKMGAIKQAVHMALEGGIIDDEEK